MNGTFNESVPLSLSSLSFLSLFPLPLPCLRCPDELLFAPHPTTGVYIYQTYFITGVHVVHFDHFVMLYIGY